MTATTKPQLPAPSAPDAMAGTSLRNLLLGNIALQTDLTEQLFSSLGHAALPQPLSRNSRPISRARSELEAIPSIYTNLMEATEEQAELLEHARRHQKRWRQLQRKRKQAQELEDKVNRVLIELERTGAELEELVEDGEHVIANIEMAEKGKSSNPMYRSNAY
jgi:predicted ribosome quality control (RQC) complex YloA/Tae2 family protein